MSAYMQGKIISMNENNSIIIVNNYIGYEVFVIDSSIYKRYSKIILWISTIQREDGITLYGFVHYEQRKLFIKLLGIAGLGPKTSMLILTKYEPPKLYQVVQQVMINIKLGVKVNMSEAIGIKGIGPTAALKIVNTLSKELVSTN